MNLKNASTAFLNEAETQERLQILEARIEEIESKLDQDKTLNPYDVRVEPVDQDKK